MIRGAVYRIDLGPARGHEQRGKRLGLVVSPSESPLSVVTVVPTSTSAGPSVHRPSLEIAGTQTRLLVDQLRSIDTDYVAGEPVDYLTPPCPRQCTQPYTMRTIRALVLGEPVVLAGWHAKVRRRGYRARPAGGSGASDWE